MKIVITKSSKKPIYEQIKDEIKRLIINGDLKPGDSLPGMRSLAKDLRISVITTKRAYNDLEEEGFIKSVAGRGTFITGTSEEFIREEKLKEIEEHLESAIKTASVLDISKSELIEILELLYKGE